MFHAQAQSNGQDGTSVILELSGGAMAFIAGAVLLAGLLNVFVEHLDIPWLTRHQNVTRAGTVLVLFLLIAASLAENAWPFGAESKGAAARPAAVSTSSPPSTAVGTLKVDPEKTILPAGGIPIPDVVGLLPGEADAALERVGLRGVQGRSRQCGQPVGRVCDMSAKKTAVLGNTVFYYLSSGPLDAE